jgi:hypothetical protein
MTGQPFFFNTARQPPVPKTLQRGCSQDSIIWLSTIMSLIAIAVSTVWMLFGNNASTYPVAVLVLAVLLLVNSRFVADFVQSRNQTWPCYIQLVVQYCLVFSMFWTSIMAYITVPQVRAPAALC